MKYKTELEKKVKRLTEAGLHIRPPVGRPPNAQPSKNIYEKVKLNRLSHEKTKLPALGESAPQLSTFIPILPKPSTSIDFPVVLAVQQALPVVEEKQKEITAQQTKQKEIPVQQTRPTLEERCRELCMSLPDLSNVKQFPVRKSKCVVVHCGHSQERNPDLFFFPFPREARRCAMWLINCDRLDLFKKDLLTIRNQCVICEDHFSVSQYYVQTLLFGDGIPGRKNNFDPYHTGSITSDIPAKRKRLICNALPTLFNIPSRPPKRNIDADMPEVHETSVVSAQEQCDDLQVILLPPSPKQQANGVADAYINGDIEMEDSSNGDHSDRPEKDLICEISNSNEQNGNICEISIHMDMASESISSGEEFLEVAKKQKLSGINKHCDKYIAEFDIAKTIQSVLKGNHQCKYIPLINDICEFKTFGENSFQEKRNAVDNAFKAIEDDVKHMRAELQSSEENEIINISDDEVQDPTLPEGIVLSPLPSEVSFTTETINRPRVKSSYRNIAPKVQIPVSRTPDSSTEIIQIAQISITRPDLPTMGPVRRREVTSGMPVIASKLSFLHGWCRAVVLDILTGTQGDKLYRIRFEGRKNGGSLCTGKQLAYTDNPTVILPVGSRVVATFKRESKETEYHAGVVAEPPKVMNKYRYLIFFDCGHAQYVSYKEIYLVCEAGKEVWEDIHQESKEFIKSYLMQYPERPMVKLQKGQTVHTELNGRWLVAHVKDVDASLVKLEFESKETEWIYRGSTRLAPLYNELANAQANRLTGKFRRHHLIGKRAHQPYVEYTRGIDEPIARPAPNTATMPLRFIEKQSVDASRPQVAKKQTGGTLPNAPSTETRIAKKSTTHERLLYNLMSDEFSNNILQSELGQREVQMLETKEHYKYYDHVCSTSCCNAMEQNLSKHKGQNPLRIPTLCGWERQIVKQRTASKRVVFYRAPCSRRLRNIEEVNQYLLCTDSKLTIDLFCFDSDVHTFSEFTPSRVLFSIPDVSYGKEDIPVPCVNSLYNEEPIYVPYSNVRFPAKGVHLNLDPEFLCGCDCEDNCQDSSKCSCQQLTINATEALPSGKMSEAGYKYRRLMEPLITGIYECNEKCKCKQSCMNRVVQNGLQVRLQLFRTERKGWGIRCLDDIPQGMFICIYAGQLLTEQGANEDGHQYGDEYLAELDHIEVVERLKEGYESDVVEPENESEESDSDESSSESSSSSEEDPPRKSKYESDSDFDVDIKEPIGSAPHSFRLRTRKINADENSSASENSCANDQAPSLVPNVSEDAYLSPPKLARQPSDTLDEKDKVMSPLGINTSEGACNPPVLSPNLPEVKKVTVPWPSTLPSDKKTDKDFLIEDANSKEEEPEVRKSLFGNLPDPTSGPLVPKTENEFKSVRQYFSEEYCYIMDAKNCGNIGRYLNHSCNPNVFVQNVFVDTHDLRFPWVAFFAMVYIRAGSELTWDYNYDVGSVPGKVMYCYCASAECRGRLL